MMSSGSYANSQILDAQPPRWGLYSSFSKWKSLPQLDCPSVTNWDVIIAFAMGIRLQIRDQFWIPQPKLHGA